MTCRLARAPLGPERGSGGGGGTCRPRVQVSGSSDYQLKASLTCQLYHLDDPTPTESSALARLNKLISGCLKRQACAR